MAKQLFDIISLQKLRWWAENPACDTDAIALLAKSVVDVLDARGREEAEAKFLSYLPDYFYNMSPMKKRRFADALAVAFCAKEDFEEFWGYLKRAGVTGRTIVL